MRVARQAEEQRRAAEAQRRLEAGGDDDATAGMSEAARRWHLTNNVAVTSDAYWAPDSANIQAARSARPWASDPNYFTEVRVSAVAAVRMMIHAKRGMPTRGRDTWFEVMGLMTGHFHERVMYVTDSFGLPVDASEVECSMNDDSMIYQAEYMNYHRRVGKPDHGCIGWYHTHPGYTCFLSGIDVNTQQLSQSTQDPWVAVVIDPVASIASGQISMKAFRTYTDEHVRNQAGGDGGGGGSSNGAPLSSAVVKKKGIYANKYYELPITLVRSRSDATQLNALLGQYWALTFSTNPLIANRAHYTQRIEDVADRARASQHGHRGRPGRAAAGSPSSSSAAAVIDRAPSMYGGAWGPFVRPVQKAEEQGAGAKKPQADLDTTELETTGGGRGGAVEEERAQELVTEMVLGGVQLAVKQKVFNGAPLGAQAPTGPDASSPLS